MIASSNQPFDTQALREKLVVGGLLESDANLSLVEYPPTFLRRNQIRRWHYRVSCERGPICHLIVGPGLPALRARAEAMASVCPELICRPLLFWENVDGMDFLCLEHFDGEILDTLVEQGRCTASQWLDRVRQAQHLLARTSQPSTEANLRAEVQSLIDDACTFPGFSKFDIQLMRELAQPAILAGALSGPLSRQWSNGDFVGRNLLVNAQGDLRLIDYEYAELTHFVSGDWLRLMTFSPRPPGVEENAIPESKAARRPSAEVRCWVHHLSLLRNIEPIAVVTQHVADTVSWLFQAIDRTAAEQVASSMSSRFVTLNAERHHRMDRLLHESATWAKSLQKELRAAQESLEKSTHVMQQSSPPPLPIEIQLRAECAANPNEKEIPAASTTSPQRRSEAAESEMRIKAALDEARLKNEGQREHAAKLQSKIAELATANEDIERLLREREHDLKRALIEFQSMRKELTRYERHWLFRLFAKARKPK